MDESAYADAELATMRNLAAARFRLYHAGRGQRILPSGGRDPRRPANPTEAQSGAVFLADLGVPAEHLLPDNEARTTRQHVAHIGEWLAAHGLESFLLVTSASHLRRAEAVFRAGGLEPIPVAADFRVGPDPVPRSRRYLETCALALTRRGEWLRGGVLVWQPDCRKHRDGPVRLVLRQLAKNILYGA